MLLGGSHKVHEMGLLTISKQGPELDMENVKNTPLLPPPPKNVEYGPTVAGRFFWPLWALEIWLPTVYKGIAKTKDLSFEYQDGLVWKAFLS